MEKQLKKIDETKFEVILERIVQLEETGVQFPKDYSPENAARSAWLILSETKDRGNKPALEVCSSASVANALLKMVTLGLNPAKKQCYFIVYGDKLECQPSYQGAIATARRFGLKSVNANVIYEGDEFHYSINEDGTTKVSNHEQSIENLDNKIIGAYAVTTLEDGTIDTTIMTMKDIRAAWEQGATNGKSPAHTKFPGEMCKKTVINRSCKTIINSSDDADLFDDAPRETPAEAYVNREIKLNAHKESLGIDDTDNTNAKEVEFEEVIPDMDSAEDKGKGDKEKQVEMSGPGF